MVTTKNDDDSPAYTAEEVSQGEVILRTPTRKVIFIGGLVLFVLVAALLAWHG